MTTTALSELIAAHMIPWRERDWPLAPDLLADRPGPLSVEVGFGDGSYLGRWAGADRARGFVGLEVAWTQLQNMLRRIDAGLDNVRVMKVDAALAFERLFEANSIREVVINHPDPWHKERHYPRRLIQPAFLADLTACLEPGGRVIIATDHNDYAQWITEALELQNALASVYPATSVSALPDREPTRYEQRARRAGIRNHFFVWEKAVGASPARPKERVGPMPNVTIEGDLQVDDFFARFQPHVLQETHDGVDVVINMIQAFRLAGDEPLWLVETLVRDGRLAQQVGVIVVPHGRTKVTVKLSAIGYPRPTHGVKRAVATLARELTDATPGLRITSSTVG